MTTWQLDPTGRFPQAAFDWVKAQNPRSLDEAFLLAARWIVDNGFTYDSSGPWRTTGIYGTVDCSGMMTLCTNLARAVMGYPAVNVPDTSYAMAQLCHQVGTGTDANTANSNPAYLGFHGPNQGMDGYGDTGHIKAKYWIVRRDDPHAGPDVSIEAMGHFVGGVGYSTFIDPQDTYYARNPFLDTAAPKVAPMFDPSQQLNARLYNRATHGWFEGYADGHVDYLDPNGNVVHGGMVGPQDLVNFAGRTLAQLYERWYIDKRGVHRFGFLIMDTAGETYVPQAQIANEQGH